MIHSQHFPLIAPNFLQHQSAPQRHISVQIQRQGFEPLPADPTVDPPRSSELSCSGAGSEKVRPSLPAVFFQPQHSPVGQQCLTHEVERV